jgi:hypothetical protein
MIKGEEVFRSVEVTDDVQTAKLSIIDQIRLIISNISNDDVAELDAQEKISADKLRKVAALSQFLDKTIERMQELGEDYATVKMSSVFLPYIDEVVNDKDGYGRYYDFDIKKKDIPMNVKHTFIVQIHRRI